MKKIIKMLPFLAIVLAAVLFKTTAGIYAEEEERIAQGVYIGNVNVGGMTAEEAENAVESYVQSVKDATITLEAGERSITVPASEFGIAFSGENVVNTAMDICKSGNLIKRYKDTKDLENGTKVVEMSLTVDHTAVADLLDTQAANLNQDAVDYGLVRESSEFTITEGRQGIAVNVDESVSAVEEFFNGSWDGSDAAVSLVADIVEPKGSMEELSKVTDLLGSYHTNFSGSTENRCENVRLATSKINGTVLYPGEEFSVHDAISPIDAEGGYQLAGAYENGQTVESYGGGVCQVSTTLYNAVIRAELEITMRFNHSMLVHYVEPSMDAAIAGNYKDLKFKNNLDAPVYIEGYCSGGIIYFNVYGKETRPSNREISFESETVSKTDPKVQFTMDASLTAGSVSVTQSGQSGCIAQLWKIVKVDGKQQSRDLFNKSNYQATPKLITIGTKDATSETLSALKAAITTGDEAKVRSAAAGLKTNAQKKEEEQKEEEKKDDTDKKEDADKSDTNKKEDSSKKDENNKKEDTKKEDSKKQDTKKETTSSTNTSTKKTQSSKKANRK